MSENKNLKQGWRIWRFDQIAQQVTDRAEPTPEDSRLYVGLEHMDPGSLKIRRWGSQTDLVGTKFRMRKGDILFARRNAYLKRVAIAPHDGLFSAHGMVLRPKASAVLPDFLPLLMQSDVFMNRAVEISIGSLSPTINWKTLAAQEFALPPLDEQDRLASLLIAQNQVIEAKQQVLVELEQCLKSTRAQVLSEGLTGQIDDTTGLPNGWTREPLSNLVEFLDHKRVPIKEADRSKRRGQYPYYGASGVIDSIDDYLFDEELILVGEDGANLLDRSSPLAFKVDGKIWVNNHAHVLRVIPPNDIDYLVDYLESISYKPYVTGTAQPKLNKAALSGVPVPVPPSEEQNAIAGVYAQFLRAKSALERELKSLGDLYGVTLKAVGGADV